MLFGISPALLAVKEAGLASDALTDDACIAVDEDAHGEMRSEVCVSFESRLKPLRSVHLSLLSVVDRGRVSDHTATAPG
jgi:hypothetical protein